jgi:hypothetical protein
MKIAFIGGGNMAGALIGGLLRAGTATATDLLAVEIDAARRAALERDFGIATAEAPDARLAGFDVLVLAVKPQQMKSACAALAPGGRLWLSTPAIQYSVGPRWVTARFERAWGHVRKGYTPAALARLFSPSLDVRIVVWPEPAFRAMQLPNWLLSRLSMGLARRIAALCFRADRRAWATGRGADTLSGHLYLSGRKPGARSESPL